MLIKIALLAGYLTGIVFWVLNYDLLLQPMEGYDDYKKLSKKKFSVYFWIGAIIALVLWPVWYTWGFIVALITEIKLSKKK